MPGYLTNRYISYNPAADFAAVQAEADAVGVDLAAAQADIEDLQLNDLRATSTVPSSIDVLVEVSGGEDFELAAPTSCCCSDITCICSCASCIISNSVRGFYFQCCGRIKSKCCP